MPGSFLNTAGFIQQERKIQTDRQADWQRFGITCRLGDDAGGLRGTYTAPTVVPAREIPAERMVRRKGVERGSGSGAGRDGRSGREREEGGWVSGAAD